MTDEAQQSGVDQAPEDTGEAQAPAEPQAAEFDRSQVQDPVLRSLFEQLDRIEALQSRLAQRFL